jgi:hypothetical protein
LRPAFLAAYIALSANRTNSAGLDVSGVRSATPMLAVTFKMPAELGSSAASKI